MATKSLGLLTLDLVAKIGGYVGPLDKAERKTKENTDKMKRYAKNVGIAFAAAGGAAVAGLAVLVKSSIDTADEMSKVSKSVGLAIEDLSALRFAADLSGVGFEELSAGLNRFNRSTSEAFEGVGAGADAYKALGIEVKRADGSLKDNYTLIEELADAFAGMQDGAQKSALAQDLFGRSGAKLIPLLNGGKAGLEAFADEAERLGLILDQETGTKSEEFNDNLARLQLTMTGLGYRLAREVAPALADFTSKVADPKFQEGLADIASGIVSIGSAAVDAVTAVTTFGRVLGEEIARITNGIDVLNLNDVQDQIDKVTSAIENPSERIRFFGRNGIVEYFNEAELKAELDKLIAQRDEILKNNPPPSVVAPASPELSPGQGWDEFSFMQDVRKEVEASAKSAKELNDRYQDIVGSLQEQIALSGDVNELDQIRYRLNSGDLKDFTDSQKMFVEQLANELIVKKDLARIDEERAAAELQLASDLESVRTQLLSQEDQLRDAAQDRFEIIEKAYIAGQIGEEEFARLAEENTKRLGEQLAALKDNIAELDPFTQAAAESIQNELSNALVAGFDGGSDDILERWGDLLKRMVADAVAADLTRALFGQTAGGSDFGTAQLVTGIGNLFAGFFDAGGNIPAGQFGIVGEYGPELVSGPATITGRKDTADMLGGSSVSIGQMVFPGITNAREAELAAGAAGRRISRIIAGSQRYN